jgi:WD40 repeat protein
MVKFWNAGTGALVRDLHAHAAKINGLALSPDGRRLVTASADGTARLWDTSSGKLIEATMEHEGAIWAAAFSPDGRIVATGGIDRRARLWDAWTGAPIGPPLRQLGEVIDMVFSADGRTLLTGALEPSARLWRIAPPIEGDLDKLDEMVRALTAQRFSSGDVIQPLDAPTWRTFPPQAISR